MSPEGEQFKKLVVELKAYAENDQMPAMHISHPSPGMASSK
jgi:hypothetical protein